MSNTNQDELTQDTLFSLLSNPRRRFIIRYLSEVEKPVPLQELATEVAAWENDTEPENLTDKERKRLYVSLYQTHIPKLEEVGVVEYDQDTTEIRLVNQSEDVKRYLDIDDETDVDRPWHVYYLAISVVGAIVYGAIALGLVEVGSGVASILGLAFVVVLAAVALYHYYSTRRGPGGGFESFTS